MFLIIQFPIADSRAYIPQETGLLQRPNWPSPRPDEDFVRSFGHIRQRWRGGLPGWVGESEVCEAKRALRFDRPPPFIYRDLWRTRKVPVKMVFRRLYADGFSVAKYEIGILLRPSTDEYLDLDESQTQALLKHILQLQVTVPNPAGDNVRCQLGNARRPLAQLYRLASSSSVPAADTGPDWWVEGGRPALLMELRRRDAIEFPFPEKHVPTKNDAPRLDYYTLPWQGLRLPLWVIEERGGWMSSSRQKKIRKAGRTLRMTLLRLHAERECLQRVLSNIADGRIVVAPGTEASDTLQDYLNETTRRIGRLERPSGKRSDGVDQSLAYFADEFVQPGRRDAVLTGLQTIRRNVLRKIEVYLAQQIYVKLWQSQGGELDLVQLATELARLKSRLAEIENPEQDESLDALASAEKAAAQGNGPRVLVHLARVGKAALEVAKDIGVSLAAAAIQGALGF